MKGNLHVRFWSRARAAMPALRHLSVAMLHLLTLYRVRCNHGRLTQTESVSDRPLLRKPSNRGSTSS